MPVVINGTTGLTGVAAIDSVSSTELGYVDGVTAPLQTQVDAKVAASSIVAPYAGVGILLAVPDDAVVMCGVCNTEITDVVSKEKKS